MPWWAEWDWILARAGGITAYALLTLAVVFGLLLSLRWQSPQRWPRMLNDDLHQRLLLWSGLFTALHILTVWIDPFTAFTAVEIWVPGASHYRPLWMALGVVAFDLGAVVALSTWLRPHIGFRWWRRIHYATFLIWALATVHGLGTGSDTATGWMAVMYAAAAAAVLGLTGWRVVQAGRGGFGPVGIALLALLGLGGTTWAATGPFRPGWNQVANNGHGNGSRLPPVAVPPAASPSWSLPLEFATTGTATANVEPGDSAVSFTFSLPSPVDATLTLVLQGQPAPDGWVVTGGSAALGPDAQHLVYRGPVAVREGGLEAVLTGPDGSRWLLRVRPVGQSGDAVTAAITGRRLPAFALPGGRPRFPGP
ncbi:MAG: ferric reductase-like transmembrane domain-containing protein [Firmicutes bacterium]|nr:ferric reductase-like transmembrane domain-containing protein [Alicyclobacillaceae bacterium]MCL6496839.1 ferric reductase-like transmembrane domain-containing protein [Bacillota bacterium]